MTNTAELRRLCWLACEHEGMSPAACRIAWDAALDHRDRALMIYKILARTMPPFEAQR